MIKALIDTNIIIDIALKRQPFYLEAIQLFRKINEQKISAFISASAITDIFYILKKSNGKDQTLTFLIDLLNIIDIVDVNKSAIIQALYSGWKDFEDAVQAQVAIENGLDIIITRNPQDYRNLQSLQVLSPHDFLEKC
jgi:predicted nucleic acid-binding protein